MKNFANLISIGRRILPERVRNFMRGHISMIEYDCARNEMENPYRHITDESFDASPFKLGIIKDVFGQRHQYYIAACKEKNVSYRVVDLTAPEWIKDFLRNDCDAYFVWPTASHTRLKDLFDYRLYIVERELGKYLFPSWKECWITEHKPRLRDWLDANGLPHPQVFISYKRSDALEYAATCELPVVVKTATGACGSGVFIIKKRSHLAQVIKRAFGEGLRPRSFDANDKQQGFIYIQEYLEDVKEWRMVRIGESFFGYRKEKAPSGHHSGSHKWSWLDPGVRLLDFVKSATDIGGFASMAVDIFETVDGRLLINECQTVFGCWTPEIQMKINGVEGRYRFIDNRWLFEEGSFCRNQMCNLRLEYLLETLSEKYEDRKITVKSA